MAWNSVSGSGLWASPPCSGGHFDVKEPGGASSSSLLPYKATRTVYIKYRCLGIRMEDIAAVAHNKVLLGATVSAAIGQLSKPLTRVLLYGEDFDPKAALLAGGFPSSHSSAVAATATALALERGLSDSIFGLSVVYAGLVMYDAQGVRREVGNHAKTINRVLRRERVNNLDDLSSDSIPVIRTTTASSGKRLTALLSEELEKQQTNQVLASAEEDYSPPPLKESVGHSEIEVIAGALLGVSVTLALHIILPYS